MSGFSFLFALFYFIIIINCKMQEIYFKNIFAVAPPYKPEFPEVLHPYKTITKVTLILK